MTNEVFGQIFDALEGDFELELWHEGGRIVEHQDVANVNFRHRQSDWIQFPEKGTKQMKNPHKVEHNYKKLSERDCNELLNLNLKHFFYLRCK